MAARVKATAAPAARERALCRALAGAVDITDDMWSIVLRWSEDGEFEEINEAATRMDGNLDALAVAVPGADLTDVSAAIHELHMAAQDESRRGTQGAAERAVDELRAALEKCSRLRT